MLKLAGTWEFIAENGKAPSPEVLRALSKVYTGMGYHAGQLLTGERAALDEAKAGTPAGFLSAARIETRLVDTKAGTVGVVLLPELSGPAPGEAQFAQAIDTAKSLRARADLVVGISPWGLDAEQLLAGKADGAFHILVGSGKGRGTPGLFAAFEKTLWVRPYAEGKAVGKIEILTMPGKDPTFKWQKDVNVRFDVVPLTDGVKDDPDTAALLAGVGK